MTLSVLSRASLSLFVLKRPHMQHALAMSSGWCVLGYAKQRAQFPAPPAPHACGPLSVPPLHLTGPINAIKRTRNITAAPAAHSILPTRPPIQHPTAHPPQCAWQCARRGSGAVGISTGSPAKYIRTEPSRPPNAHTHTHIPPTSMRVAVRQARQRRGGHLHRLVAHLGHATLRRHVGRRRRQHAVAEPQL